jgi:hypothetical protein
MFVSRKEVQELREKVERLEGIVLALLDRVADLEQQKKERPKSHFSK